MKEQKQCGSSYGNIFKTTFLFGFVQVFNIIVKVGLNKIVAILLGAEGMGIMGIYNSVSQMIKTGAGLGVNQSAVRDISEANAVNNRNVFSKIISLTNKVILFTSALGIFVTIILSPFLSKWSFGDYSYTIAFIWISIVVGLNVFTDGQLAILKGMRQLRALAKASVWGSLAGLLTAIPFYYFFGKGGIIPSLIMSAFAALFFSNYYVQKIEYEKVKLTIKEIYQGSKLMVKMGIALMLVSFIGATFDMIVAAFISNQGGLADVGFYNAGATIITSYFGIIITAMSTDYYPRISAINDNNERLKEEMDKQTETGLIMVFPLVVLFVFLSPFFIELLYSNEFYSTNEYTDYAMIGTVIIVVSNCMGMILLAKQASNIFIISVLSQRIILIAVYLLLYKHFGLMGLGFSYIINGVIHIAFMTVILKHFYNISLARRVVLLLFIVIIMTLIAIAVRSINSAYIRYLVGFALFFLTCIYSLRYLKNKMDIDLILVLKNKIKKQ
jgi:O-antigen/teichoic acid export membrane protein